MSEWKLPAFVIQYQFPANVASYFSIPRFVTHDRNTAVLQWLQLFCRVLIRTQSDKIWSTHHVLVLCLSAYCVPEQHYVWRTQSVAFKCWWFWKFDWNRLPIKNLTTSVKFDYFIPGKYNKWWKVTFLLTLGPVSLLVINRSVKKDSKKQLNIFQWLYNSQNIVEGNNYPTWRTDERRTFFKLLEWTLRAQEGIKRFFT